MVHTSVETTANGRDDDLDSVKTTHSIENRPILVVDSMNSVHMDEGSDCKEYGGTDRLEQIELGAALRQGQIPLHGGKGSHGSHMLTCSDQVVSKNAIPGTR